MPPKAADGKPRLDSLDAPRWIASIQIVFSHFYFHDNAGGDLGYFAKQGKMWTQMFFILSGFVLGYVEMARPSARAPNISQLAYLRKRLTTVYPTYFFAIFWEVLSSIYPGNNFKLAVLPANLLLVQGIVPWCAADFPKQFDISWTPWNGPAWFMSALIIYWLLLRPMARYFRNVSLTMSWVWLLACWAFSLVIHLVKEAMGLDYNTCFYYAFQNGALGYLHTFIAGIVTARIFILTSLCDEKTRAGVVNVDDCGKLSLDRERAPFIFRWGCCLGYSLYTLFILIVDVSGDGDSQGLWLFWHNGGIMPFMLLIIIGSAVGADPIARNIFTHPLPVALAQLSFSQYLLQFPVHNLMYRFVPKAAPYSYYSWPLWANLSYIPILITVAYVVQRFIQRPYTEWQNWRGEKKIKGFDDRAIEWIDARIAGFNAPPPSDARDVEMNAQPLAAIPRSQSTPARNSRELAAAARPEEPASVNTSFPTQPANDQAPVDAPPIDQSSAQPDQVEDIYAEPPDRRG